MRLRRPYLSLDVRLQVAARQLTERAIEIAISEEFTKRQRLTLMLFMLFHDEPIQLDHEPALVLREYNEKTERYIPDACDPNFLMYRTKENHHFKTFVRGDGAQLSDAGKRRKEIKRRKKTTKRKYKWPSRKLRSRSSLVRKHEYRRTSRALPEAIP